MRGRVTSRRSTVIWWRRTAISTFFTSEAWPPPTMPRIRCSTRNARVRTTTGAILPGRHHRCSRRRADVAPQRLAATGAPIPFLHRVSYPRRMSEPEERDRPNGGGVVEGSDNESVEKPDLSDTGIGLSVGEPNTFEPEEAGPAVERPSE